MVNTIYQYCPGSFIRELFIYGFVMLLPLFFLFSDFHGSKAIPGVVYTIVFLSFVITSIYCWKKAIVTITASVVRYNKPPEYLRFANMLQAGALSLFVILNITAIKEGTMVITILTALSAIMVALLLTIQLATFLPRYWTDIQIPIDQIKEVRVHWYPDVLGGEHGLQVFLRGSSEPIEIIGFDPDQYEEMRNRIKKKIEDGILIKNATLTSSFR